MRPTAGRAGRVAHAVRAIGMAALLGFGLAACVGRYSQVQRSPTALPVAPGGGIGVIR